MDIAAMLFWMFTVGAGVYLLATSRPARGPAEDVEGAAAPEPAGVARTAGVPAAAVAAYASGAPVPPITHTRITTRPGEHPLLEFMHPALGMAGLACSIGFVITHASAFAWAAFGVVVATIAAGVTWYTANARAAARAEAATRAGGARAGTARAEVQGPAEARDAEGTNAPEPPEAGSAPPARRYPSRRLLVHGSGAAVTFVLVIVSALIAHHS